MSETMHFDLDWVKIPVTIGEKKYILQEASGEATVAYRNRLLMESHRREEGDESGPGLASTEPLLLSMCLYDSESGVFLKEEEVLRLPGRIQRALYQKAREISGMDDDDEEDAAKNDLSGSTDGSDLPATTE